MPSPLPQFKTPSTEPQADVSPEPQASKKIFFYAFLVSWALGLFGWNWLANTVLRQMSLSYVTSLVEQQQSFLQESAAQLPPFYLGNAVNPSEVRQRRQFISRTINGLDLPLRVFDNPSLFESVFPGYSFQDTSLPFWDSYFKQAFNDPNVWVSALANERKPFLTLNLVGSWLGGIDILQNLGADIVTLGTSEVSTSIIPAQLSRELQSLFQGKPRVLGIGGPGQYSTIVHLTASTIARTGQRPALVIWGYSFWDAFMEAHPRPSATSLKLSEYQAKYPQASLSQYFLKQPAPTPEQPSIRFDNDFWKEKMSDHFPSVSWNDLFEEANRATIQNIPLLYWDMLTRPEISQLDQEEGYRVRLDLINDEEKLRKAVRKARAQYPYLNGIRPQHCDLREAKEIFNKTVDEILKSTDRLLIYLPPAVPELYESLPPCFLPAVKELMNSRAGHNVKVITGDWTYYGLQYKDFVYPGLLAGYAGINVNHTNFEGAKKVTAKIGEALRGWLQEVGR